MLDFSGTERALSAHIVKKLKQRLNPKPTYPSIDIEAIKREITKRFGSWFGNKIDSAMYRAINGGKTNSIKNMSKDVPLTNKKSSSW